MVSNSRFLSPGCLKPVSGVCMSNYTIHCSRTTHFVLYNARRLLAVGGIVWLLVMGAFSSLVTQSTTCIAIQQTLPLIPQKTNGRARPTAGIQSKGRKD